MTTNIERAAEVLARTPYVHGRTMQPQNARLMAQALANATPTLLMPDLPEPDRDGFWWPEHGRNYGNVHVSPVYVRDVEKIIPMVTIARGGPGEASRHTSMNLTREEALELASLLTAAARYERSQE